MMNPLKRFSNQMSVGIFLRLLLFVFFATGYATEDFSAFIKGGTMSHVVCLEAAGFVYRDANGVPENPYVTMKKAGWNYAHYDLWTGTNSRDINYVKAEALKAKHAGLKVMINFFYSDNYNCNLPAGWPSEIAACKQTLYDYTLDCLNQLSANGVVPDIVKIGNEIDGKWRDGFCLPLGQKSTHYADFVALLQEGIRATRTFNPDIKIALHSAHDNPSYNNIFYGDLLTNGVDFDIIALSAYGESGYTFPVLQTMMDTLALNFNKKILIVETAYRWTDQNFDSTPNGYTEIEPGYPHTEAGCYGYIVKMMDIVAKTPGNKGVGIMIWPAAYCAYPGCASTRDGAALWNSSTGIVVSAVVSSFNRNVNIGSGLVPTIYPDDTVSLYSTAAQYVKVDAMDGYRLIANAPTVSGNAEKFYRIRNMDGTYSFQSLTNNKYVTAANTTAQLIADAVAPGLGQKFTIETRGDGTFALMSAQTSNHMDANRTLLWKIYTEWWDMGGAWQSFVMTDLGNSTSLFALQHSSKTAVSIFPNPFNPRVNISITGWTNGTEVKILNINGETVANLTAVINNNPQAIRSSRQVIWNASGCASGMYLVILKNGKAELKRKIVLLR
ncbi:MAG: glycosyl hydrolase 53 family protein [Fibrobacterota bacterium]